MNTQHRVERCSPDVLRILGDFTTLRIIDCLAASGMRFTELRTALVDTNSVTLTNRLKRLSDAGLLKRAEATLNRQSVTYELSDLGKALLPVLRQIKKFAVIYHSAEASQR
jgi:DNA-binding HxlR family transcriptional regulator